MWGASAGSWDVRKSCAKAPRYLSTMRLLHNTKSCSYTVVVMRWQDAFVDMEGGTKISSMSLEPSFYANPPSATSQLQ
jgi:hypothetical protein